jgi:hypothetical protein
VVAGRHHRFRWVAAGRRWPGAAGGGLHHIAWRREKRCLEKVCGGGRRRPRRRPADPARGRWVERLEGSWRAQAGVPIPRIRCSTCCGRDWGGMAAERERGVQTATGGSAHMLDCTSQPWNANGRPKPMLAMPESHATSAITAHCARLGATISILL